MNPRTPAVKIDKWRAVSLSARGGGEVRDNGHSAPGFLGGFFKVHVGCGSWGCLLLRLRVNIHAAPPLLPSSTADAGMIKEETDDCGVHCGGRALLTSPACRGNSVCWVYSLGEMTTIDR